MRICRVFYGSGAIRVVSKAAKNICKPYQLA
jgi:hypothetical protein